MIRPNFVLGLSLGLNISFITVWLVGVDLSKEWVSIVSAVVGGAFTLVAAGVAWRSVQRQISEQRQIVSDQRKAKLASFRSILPLALSETLRLAGEAFDLVMVELAENEVLQGGQSKLRAPQLSDATIEIFRENIEAASLIDHTDRKPDEFTAEWLALVMHMLQICQSRTLSAARQQHLNRQDQLGSLASDWHMLSCVLGHCFRYSRGRVPLMPEHLDLENLGVGRPEAKFSLTDAYKCFIDSYQRDLLEIPTGSISEIRDLFMWPS